MPTGKESQAILERPSVHHCGQKGCDDYTSTTREGILEHKRTVPHEFTGYDKCKDCGKPNLEKKITMILGPQMTEDDVPVYCDECLKRNVEDARKRGLVT